MLSTLFILFKRQQHWTEETAALDRRDSSIGQKRQQYWTEETAALDRRDSSIGQKRQNEDKQNKQHNAEN
jgi:hypothetical protein